MNFWEQVKGWEVIVFLCCAAILILYFASQMDLENTFKKDSPVPVHMGGKIQTGLKLDNVKTVDIPPHIYESLDRDSKFKRYLTGNHKYILLFTYNGCPYARAYHHAFKQSFEEQGFAEYYRKRIILTGRVVMASCPTGFYKTCPSMWVFEQCFGKICVINPQRKQVIVDASNQADQLPKLLETYKEW